MARVVHFEIFSGDTVKSVQFYREVFGWDISQWEAPFEYHVVTTGPAEEIGINGAIAPFDTAVDQTVVLTTGVGDIDATIGRAVNAGATLVSEKHEIAGVGLHAYVRDPAGTIFGVLQPSPMMGQDEAGRDVWSEFGDSLRQLGETLAGAFSDAAASPQAKRARDEAERAARGIRDASAGAADKARPHVISALDRVSVELGNLASRLRRDEVAGQTTPEEQRAEEARTPEPPAEKPGIGEPGDVDYTPPPSDEC